MRATRTRTSKVAAALIGIIAVSGAGAAMAASSVGGPANPTPAKSSPKAPSRTAALSALPVGSELKFVPVQPCRIIDTRRAGGVVTNTVRHFSAFGGYAGQGGNAAGCGIPSYAKALSINIGAISQGGSSGYVKGYPFGTAEPLASLVNFDKSGAVANMVNLPVTAGNPSFSLKVQGSAHLFADVAGYYAATPYVAVSPDGSINTGIASGVVSVTKGSTGRYTIVFDRPVRGCGATTNTIVWDNNTDASADVGASGNANAVEVGVTNTSNAFVDDWFSLSLSC